MKKDIFSSPALTAFLTLITPIFFVWGNNWHMYEPSGLLLAALFVLFVGVSAFLLTAFFNSKIKKNRTRIPKILFIFICVLFSLLIIETCCFFLQTSLFAAIPEPRWKRILLTRVVPFIIFLILLYKNALKLVNIFFLIYLCISFVPATINMISNDNKQIKSIVLFDSYKIEKTPNIYLFFLESYHSLDIQRNIYNINTEEIEIYLQRQQFKIYPEIYSNSSSTLQSFTDTFHFFATSEFVKGNSDAAISIRNLVCGDENNTLFKILKNNGYSTILLANSSYYGTRKGQNLDHSDFLPNEDTIAYYIYKSVVPLSSLNTRLHFLPSKLRPWAIQSGESTFFSDPLFNRVKQSFEIHKKTGVPIFVTFKGGACHTPPDGSYTWRNLEEWVESQTYQNAVKHANKELIEICDYIISQDPGSLIILIGDHGSWRLRGAENPASNREQLHQSLINNGISIDSFCKDIFGVFLAIRLPYGDTTDISQNMAMTHVNLFRHIFAYINKDLTILETRAPANCYYNSIPLIEDGKIIQPFK